ncbi:MAG: hypothetical protein K8R69_01010 [Deltaproteobacteria bacterium]|nr:hypothetical protein [Deltaproteobacteria bacterium]
MKLYPLFLAVVCLFSTPAIAKMAATPGGEMSMVAMPMPQPPAENPHPPRTAEDRKRVDFAVQEIRAYYGPKVEIRHAHIIPWSFENFQKNRRLTSKPVPPTEGGDPNVIIEAQPGKMAPPVQDMAEPARSPIPPMPAPKLQADEYMVHAYVLFPQDPRWYHVDVILSEDASGNLVRRNFFVIPMPPVGGSLPPGVVC